MTVLEPEHRPPERLACEVIGCTARAEHALWDHLRPLVAEYLCSAHLALSVRPGRSYTIEPPGPEPARRRVVAAIRTIAEWLDRDMPRPPTPPPGR